ncbi:hypothetical protein BSLG_001915 [Batrachochytrium salamandrivorans]|nr:hypothetical protein BSLG_001915 [Batrachochytrium salamandrivorans]
MAVSRIVSAVKYKALAENCQRLILSIYRLSKHRQWKLGGPTSSLPDSDYGAATFNDASKKMSSFDLAMIEFGKENGLALLKESIFSTLNRFLPNTNILDFVEIVAIMSLFPADSLLFGCLASQSIFEQDRISATEDRTGIPVVPLLQEWILSQRLPDSTCVIWRLHPWLVASLYSKKQVLAATIHPFSSGQEMTNLLAHTQFLESIFAFF